MAQEWNDRRDRQLLGRMVDGDREALGELYDAHANALFGHALVLSRRREEADDLVQDVFVKLAGLGVALLGIRGPGAYLHRTLGRSHAELLPALQIADNADRVGEPHATRGCSRRKAGVRHMNALRSIVVRGALVALAALALAGAGHAGQSGGSKVVDFDPSKKGVWRFLDDDLYAIRLEGAKAYAAADYKGAAKHYLTYLHRNGRDGIVIYNLARCYSRMGDADSAVELLARAIREGFVHPELLREDKEFDPIRESRVFRNHLKTLGGVADALGQTIPVSGARLNLTRVRLPASYDASKAYPLLVGLHGNGSNNADIMQSLVADAFPGMICAAPNAAYARTDLAALPGERLSWFLPDADRSLWPTMDPLTSEYIQNVIAELSKRYRVSQVMLLGFSQGVPAAYLTALRSPDRVSGVIAIAGGFPRTSFTPEQIKAGSRIRIMIAHGVDDKQVGLESSQRARDTLRENGYRVQFETFEGGHSLPPDLMRSVGQWIRFWLKDAPLRPSGPLEQPR